MPHIEVVLIRVSCGNDNKMWSWHLLTSAVLLGMYEHLTLVLSAISLIVNEAQPPFPGLIVQVQNVSEASPHPMPFITRFSLFFLIDL